MRTGRIERRSIVSSPSYPQPGSRLPAFTAAVIIAVISALLWLAIFRLLGFVL
jgi:hypothetical protein